MLRLSFDFRKLLDTYQLYEIGNIGTFMFVPMAAELKSKVVLVPNRSAPPFFGCITARSSNLDLDRLLILQVLPCPATQYSTMILLCF